MEQKACHGQTLALTATPSTTDPYNVKIELGSLCSDLNDWFPKGMSQKETVTIALCLQIA